MKRTRVIFVDVLEGTLTAKNLGEALRHEGRHVQILQNENPVLQDDLEALRPVMEVKDWLSRSESLMHDEMPDYEEYMCVALCGSPYTRLLYLSEGDRSLAAHYTNKVHKSYKIYSDHYLITGEEHKDPEWKISRVNFVNMSAGKEVYRSFRTVEDLAKHLGFKSTKRSKGSVHIKTLSGRNLTEI